MAVVRLRPHGQTVSETLATKRKVARRRWATDEQVLQIAPGWVAALAILVLPAANLSTPGVDGNAPSSSLAWLLVCCVPLAVLAAWIGVDRWLRPGTVIRVLRRDGFVALSAFTTLVLAMASSVIALLEVRSSGLWLALFLVQMVWIFGDVIAGVAVTSRRKNAAASALGRA
jgi:hypothetical protein